ncbi:MAG: hypothetical protein IT371_29855, partial [Deltaproteobacteria bacterium]|nr:hypothetical protein [Deltaproteobacteria bacterium]
MRRVGALVWVSLAISCGAEQLPADGGPLQDASADAARTDARPGDVGAPDSGVPDAQPADGRTPDRGAGDARMPDAQVPDARVPDARVPDARVPDARVPDARVPDARVPDARPPDAAGFTRVSGSVQKGPFSLGSTVSLALLDGQGNPTGQIYPTTTTDDFGRFDVTVPGASLLRAEAVGFFLDEWTGSLSVAALTLRGVLTAPSGPTDKRYVNTLTHLAERRALSLMRAGATPAAAVAQAERETIAALGIFHPAGTQAQHAEQVDLLVGSSGDAAYLLVTSCILAKIASDAGGGVAALQLLLNRIALDLEPDGLLSPTTKADLVAAEKALPPLRCHDHLVAWLVRLGLSGSMVPDPLLVVDSDRDGLPNGTDPDDD